MKNMKHRNTKLYNLILPIWLVLAVPMAWIIILPANFIIDLLVTFLTLKIIGVTEKKEIIKKSILKIWGFGFAADFVGAVILLIGHSLPLKGWWYDNISLPLLLNPFNNIFSFMYMFIAVGISAIMIYIFNMIYGLKNTALDDITKKKLAISLAFFTAPYFFFIPTELFGI